MTTQVQQHTHVLLKIRLKDGITPVERAGVFDALNETLHALADDPALVDDANDDGWSYVNPLEASAPDLLAALQAVIHEWATNDAHVNMSIDAALDAIRKATGEE